MGCVNCFIVFVMKRFVFMFLDLKGLKFWDKEWVKVIGNFVWDVVIECRNDLYESFIDLGVIWFLVFGGS